GRVAEVALTHLSLRDLLDALLASVADVLRADTATILLVDDDDGHLHTRATVGFGGEVEHTVPVPLGEGLAGTVAASRTPLLVDWCAIDMLTADGGLRRVAVAHDDPDKQRRAWELAQSRPPTVDNVNGLRRAIESGKPLLVPEYTPEMLEDVARGRPEARD